mgnify:CR=1 FL=1
MKTREELQAAVDEVAAVDASHLKISRDLMHVFAALIVQNGGELVVKRSAIEDVDPSSAVEWSIDGDTRNVIFRVVKRAAGERATNDGWDDAAKERSSK